MAASKAEATFEARLNGSVFWAVFIVTGVFGIAVLPSVADSNLASKVCVIIAMLLLVLTLFMKVTLEVKRDHLRIRMFAGLYQQRIPLANIQAVAVGPNTGILNGAGLRVRPGALMCIVGGPSVELTLKEHNIVVSVQDPQAAIRAIQRARGVGRPRGVGEHRGVGDPKY